MSKTKISTVNYQSSFKFVLRARDVKGHELDLTVLDWKATFWTVTGGTTWEVSKIEGEMVNCRIKRGRVLAIAHNHKLPAGKLKCEIIILSPDEDFPGMQRRTVSPEHIDIELVPGKGDCECDDVSISAELEVPLVVQEKSIAGTIRPIEVPDKIMPYNARYGYAYRLKTIFGINGNPGGGSCKYIAIMKITNFGDSEIERDLSRLFPGGFLQTNTNKHGQSNRYRIHMFHDRLKGNNHMSYPDYTDVANYDAETGILTLGVDSAAWVCLEAYALHYSGIRPDDVLVTLKENGSVKLIKRGDAIRYTENIPKINMFSYSLSDLCFNVGIKYGGECENRSRRRFFRRFEDQNLSHRKKSFIKSTKSSFPFELEYLRFPLHYRYVQEANGNISWEKPEKRCHFPKWTRTVRKSKQYGFFRIRYVSPRDKFIVGPWEYFFLYRDSHMAKRVYGVTTIDKFTVERKSEKSQAEEISKVET